MGVNSRTSVDPRYKNHAWLPLSGFANAKLQVLIPNTGTADDTFNPFTNKSVTQPTVVWTGWGQLNVFRQTLNAFMPASGITQIRSMRFVVPSSGPSVPVRKGMQVRIIECEDQPDACFYQYTITSGITGTLAFSRDFEAEADMGTILGDPGQANVGYGAGGYGE